MSFELERIVNQLEIVTRSLDFIDKNVTEHERIIDTLSNTEKVDNIIGQMEEKGLMTSQIYNSAWQAQNRLEGEEPVINTDSNVEEEELPLEEDDYEKFLQEEEAKRRRFQEQMGLQGEEQIDFKASQVFVQQEQF